MRILRRSMQAMLLLAVVAGLSFVFLGLRHYADTAAREHVGHVQLQPVKYFITHCEEFLPRRVNHEWGQCWTFYIPRAADPDVPKELTLRL